MIYGPAPVLWPRAAVPADLLHVVVELDQVTIGIDGERGVVHAGGQLGRQVTDSDAALFKKPDRVLQLFVAVELDPEGHAVGMVR